MNRPNIRRYVFIGLAILVGIAELWALRRARWHDDVGATRALRT